MRYLLLGHSPQPSCGVPFSAFWQHAVLSHFVPSHFAPSHFSPSHFVPSHSVRAQPEFSQPLATASVHAVESVLLQLLLLLAFPPHAMKARDEAKKMAGRMIFFMCISIIGSLHCACAYELWSSRSFCVPI